MTLVYILVMCVPVGLILLVFAAIGIAVFKTAMSGKRAYEETKPFVVDLKQRATAAQQKSVEIAQRGKALSDSFQEIQGRWAFVSQSFKEISNSPFARFAGAAGKSTGRKKARTDNSTITVFDSTGLAIQDLAIAEVAMKSGRALNLPFP